MKEDLLEKVQHPLDENKSSTFECCQSCRMRDDARKCRTLYAWKRLMALETSNLRAIRNLTAVGSETRLAL